VKIAALLVALFAIVVGIAGLVSPDGVTAVRRLYFATPVGLSAAGAVRVAMGVVVVLCASASRAFAVTGHRATDRVALPQV